ncbi:MAG: ADP-ribosylglycohydrolase family protein [Verrucomicrobiia bacterium]|jgi:ADP-ribosylglycohydrolase
MLGAIAGDIIGSIYENLRTKRKDFRLFSPVSFFTDDTVLTVAVAEALLDEKEFGPTIKAYAWRRPLRGYGSKFYCWMCSSGCKPYNSLGNGSAMRVSPVAYAGASKEEVLRLAARSAECTHNHPEGIKGAQAVALCVYMARTGATKDEIRKAIKDAFRYDVSRHVEEIRPTYRMNLTCPGSVPEAIVAFLDSHDFEDSIRNAVSLGGDADTQAAIAGSIAEAFYGGVPLDIARRVWHKLPASYQRVILRFERRYNTPTSIEDITGSDRLPVAK